MGNSCNITHMANRYVTIKVFPATKRNAEIAAVALGISMSGFIDLAVREKIERDTVTVGDGVLIELEARTEETDNN